MVLLFFWILLIIAQVHVADYVHDAAVGFLGQAFVLAAVAGFHVEDGDMQPLGSDGGQAGVGIAQNQHGIGLGGSHQLVGAVDDIAHGFAQVIAHGIHVHLRILQAQIPEENAV